MTSKELIALIVFVALFSVSFTLTVVYEHVKCNHIEVGEITHNPFLE